MNIKENISLASMNTFWVDVSARFFVRVQSIQDIVNLMHTSEWGKIEKKRVLGGGSNILFSQNFDGLIIKNEIMGIEVLEENDDEIIFRVGAGESWHGFVMLAAQQNIWGIENLALIPGSVGASPVQNIGAYGVQVSDCIESVEYVSLLDGQSYVKKNNECHFSYRNSWFKEHSGEHIITRVSFRLSKKAQAQLSYGKLAEKLQEKKIDEPRVMDMVQTVIEIRNTKLPLLGEIGMAGSFFKNPIVSEKQLEDLEKKFPEIPSFSFEKGRYKIPAGWLLEYLGFRGAHVGNVGNYKKHALVVVHNGKGTGKEIVDYVERLRGKVYEVFGIDIEPEVNIF